MSFLYFIILIGVLIFVHELGHFVVAKFFGVGVIRFSIGFGPSILSYQGKETEYVICLLPLGGYVLMEGADLESTEAMPEDQRERCLMAKPIWQRTLVVLAGPVANLILPVAIYFLFGMMQATTPPALVGEVFGDTPAAEAGIQPGDRIVSINGRSVDYWYQTLRIVHGSYEREVELTYERDGELHTVNVVPERFTSTDFLGLSRETVGRIGIGLGTDGTTLALYDRNGPAARAGLQFFDKVVSIDGNPVERFDEIASAVRTSGGESMEFLVLRPHSLDVDFAGLYHQTSHRVVVTPEAVDGQFTIGIEPSQMYLARVEADGPAHQAGLRSGDKLLTIDGRSYNNWSLVNERIRNEVNEAIVARDEAGDDDAPPVSVSFELTVERNGEVLALTYAPDIITYEDQTEQTLYRVDHGWETFRDIVYPDEIHHPFFSRMVFSAQMGVEQTWEFTQMMIVGLQRLAQGRISLKSVGGPIMIGELAAEAGRAGIEPFLRMMALISINLAIINLLPIPILDGGRLVFFALEAIKRGPLSYRTRQIAAYIGLVLIIMLMILAFKNDIERNWYRVVEYFETESE